MSLHPNNIPVPSSPWQWVLRYGLAYAAVAAGFGLRVASTAWTGPGLPTYITFYPAVMVAALLAGFGPGLLATALAALTTAYWILPPNGFAIASPVDRVGMMLFTGMGLFMSTVAELYRRSRRKAAAYDQEMAMRETRREKEFFADVLEHASQPFAVGYPYGRLGLCNTAYEQLTGYSAEELRTLDWAVTLTPPEWHELERQKLHELSCSGRPVRYEKEYVRKDGTRVPVELLVHLVKEADGKPEYYYSFLTDITARKATEEALGRSKQTFVELVERSPFGVYVVDSQFRIAQMNTASQTGAFQNVRPVIGRDFSEAMRILWPDPIAGKIIAAFRHTLETGESYYSPRFINLRRDVASVEAYEWELHRMTLADGQYGVICYYFDSTKLRDAEAALRRAKEEWERTFDSVPDMVAIMDDRHRILRANRAMAERLGCSPEECIGEICYKCVHGATAPPAFCPHVQTLVDGQEHMAEIHESRLGGDFLVSTTPLLNERGDKIGSVHVARDVTESKQREEELRRLNRTLKALGRSNQALTRTEKEMDFLNEACRIIVEDCGHPMVWIGYAEQDEAQSVRPVAYAGFEEGYLETLRITWADTERGRGPTGTAIRTGKPCACPDMLTDPKFAPWRAEALQRGYASSVVLPLLANGKAFGAITIYFAQAGALSEHELRLLTELADDVAYGVGAIRLRNAHAQAEAAMRSSEERLTTFAAATFEGIVLSDDGRIVDCNEQFAQMVGCKAEELKGVIIGDLIVPEDRERVLENIRLGRESLVEHGLLRKDGTRLIVEAQGRPLSATDSRRRHTAVRDITARKQAEEAVREARDQLEIRVLERTAELRVTYEELKGAMTEQRRLEAEILEISDSERQRIGQDLHDGLTQHLNGILYMGETLRQRMIEHLTVKPAELARLTELLREGVTQSRDLAYGLNPVGVEPDGLVVALKRFAGTVRQTFKISCRLEDSQPITLQDDKVATHLYRIAQESVQNAIKHGKAKRVTMRLREADNLITLDIRDNGIGLTDGCKPHSGMGLHIMRYRARACGGSLSIRKGTRGGTWVICSVPLSAPEKRKAT